MSGKIFEFGPFRLDEPNRRLTRGGDCVALAPHAFDALLLLVDHAGELVTRKKLIEELWPDVVVEESNLNWHIGAVRKALGEAPDHYIETARGRGYRFRAPVRVIDGANDDKPVPVPARRGWRAVAAAAFVLAIGGAAWFGFRPSAAVPAAKSIAVLPFANLSTDPANRYFAGGVREEILTRLVAIRDLRVISSTTAARYPAAPADLPAIADRLGADAVLEGSVQKAGGRIRINVQLIDARTDKHLWARSFDRPADKIFDVETEVAQSVAGALEANLTPAEARRIAKAPTANQTAYEAYLKANHYLNEFNKTLDRQALQKTVELAHRAVRLDPKFAPGWSLLALAYLKLQAHAGDAEAAARLAIALDPELASAHERLALALATRGDVVAAIGEATEAVRLEPQSAYLHYGLGLIMARAGRWEESVDAYRHAVALAPQESFMRLGLAQSLAALRRYDEARDGLKLALAADPADAFSARRLAKVYWLGWGDLQGARTVLEAASQHARASALLADAWYWQHFLARNFDAARAVVKRAPPALFSSEGQPRGLYLGRLYRAAGDKVAAAAAFRKARDWIKLQLEAAPADALPQRANLYAALAEVLAGLDEPKQAIDSARRAVELVPVEKDALRGPVYLLALARTYALTNHADAALKTLRQLLSLSAGWSVSVRTLELDPTFDAVRKDRRFEDLLASRS